LKWEKQEQSFDAKVQDKEVTATYRFTNTGRQRVKIESVDTSCGCTTAALSKTDYSPGESGEITATFKFEGRTGRQEKAIMVATSTDVTTTNISAAGCEH
jgi:Protein of unknown function (DUF1573)